MPNCKGCNEIAGWGRDFDAHESKCLERQKLHGLKDDSGKLQLEYLGRFETWNKIDIIPNHILLAMKNLDDFWFGDADPIVLLGAINALRKVVTLEDEIAVRKFGAEKYGLLNYRKGMKWSRLFGAARRHLYEYPLVLLQSIDPDHGRSHEAAAICCISFLYEYATEYLGEDDRQQNIKSISKRITEEQKEILSIMSDNIGCVPSYPPADPDLE